MADDLPYGPLSSAPGRPPAASDAAAGGPPARAFGRSLSAKLLLLTIAFVVAGQIVVFVPSIASFRLNWLNERLTAAQIAALAVEAAPNNAVPDRLREELLRSAGVHAIAIVRDSARYMILQSEMPDRVGAQYDLRRAGVQHLMRDALVALLAPDTTMLVTGESDFRPGDAVEIVLSQAPLTAALVDFARGVVAVTLVISLLTAVPVYYALNFLFVRPMTRLTQAMERFSAKPEDAGRIIAPSARGDEIGIAERELAAMQGALAGMLRQKSRLASLGLAVSKINHDLRNMLASSQLLSDRLARVPDTTVQQIMPKLVASLDRAILLCTETLRYGRAEEAAPVRQLLPLHELVAEVGDALGLGRGEIEWQNAVPTTLQIDADSAQLYRILLNLLRNAVESLSLAQGELRIAVTAERSCGTTTIRIADTGRGIPPEVRERLFMPFQGSARKDGMGLGLAICAELAEAHGGSLTLEEHAAAGACFRIEIPDREDRAVLRAELAEPPRRATLR